MLHLDFNSELLTINQTSSDKISFSILKLSALHRHMSLHLQLEVPCSLAAHRRLLQREALAKGPGWHFLLLTCIPKYDFLHWILKLTFWLFFILCAKKCLRIEPIENLAISAGNYDQNYCKVFKEWLKYVIIYIFKNEGHSQAIQDLGNHILFIPWKSIQPIHM